MVDVATGTSMASHLCFFIFLIVWFPLLFSPSTFRSPLFSCTCVCLPKVTCDPFCALLAYFEGFQVVTVRVQKWAL